MADTEASLSRTDILGRLSEMLHTRLYRRQAYLSGISQEAAIVNRSGALQLARCTAIVRVKLGTRS